MESEASLSLSPEQWTAPSLAPLYGEANGSAAPVPTHIDADPENGSDEDEDGFETASDPDENPNGILIESTTSVDAGEASVPTSVENPNLDDDSDGDDVLDFQEKSPVVDEFVKVGSENVAGSVEDIGEDLGDGGFEAEERPAVEEEAVLMSVEMSDDAKGENLGETLGPAIDGAAALEPVGVFQDGNDDNVGIALSEDRTSSVINGVENSKPFEQELNVVKNEETDGAAKLKAVEVDSNAAEEEEHDGIYGETHSVPIEPGFNVAEAEEVESDDVGGSEIDKKEAGEVDNPEGLGDDLVAMDYGIAEDSSEKLDGGPEKAKGLIVCFVSVEPQLAETQLEEHSDVVPNVSDEEKHDDIVAEGQSEHIEPESNVAKAEEVELDDVGGSEILKMESMESKVGAGEADIPKGLQEDLVNVDSGNAENSLEKLDIGSDKAKCLIEDFVSVEPQLAMDSAGEYDDVNDVKSYDGITSLNQDNVDVMIVPESAELILIEPVHSSHILGGKSEVTKIGNEVVDKSGIKENDNISTASDENTSLISVSDGEVKPSMVGAYAVATASTNDDGAAAAADDEKMALDNAEEAEVLVSDGTARVEILENSGAAKQIMKESEEGSSTTGPPSGLERSEEHSYHVDGQIVSDSDEEDTGEEGEGREFNSTALAALLKAAADASPNENIKVTSQDLSRFFSANRPAGLGSSIPALRPAASRPSRPRSFTPSDLVPLAETENDMSEEEKKLQEKVEQIRVKFLRLVQRLGHSPEDTMAAQVLYRLGLAEGIKLGRQSILAFTTERAKKKALQLEEETTVGLDFSCNILILGKAGVGKSATINSIFGERKSHTNAFSLATTSVREITGIVDGVKIRVLDTPGLRASVMEQAVNRKVLLSIKNYTKRCPPDIVLYVDRLDTHSRDFNDLHLLKSITSVFGSSMWYNAIVALSHAASAPPDGPNGSPLTYEVFIAQKSHVIQQSIRLAAGDMRLMNPVALVENHSSCRRNRDGERVLPNGLSWRTELLLLCYSSKILSEANSLLKLQDPSPGKLFGFRFRSPPLPFLLSSLLQSRAHPKLSTDQGGENADSDIDDFSDTDQNEEDEYDLLPPFKPLRKAQIAKLTKEQRRAYFDEYDYRVKLLQKKQWKEEIRRMKEMKKSGKSPKDDFTFGDMAKDFDQDGAPAAVPVPLPDMVLPPSFDCDNPVYRYRFLEPTSQLLIRPVLDSHGWDHDCGYDGVNIEENLAIAGRFPAGVTVQITKDKKEFNAHLDSSISAKHGEKGSTLAGFDIQTIGKQFAYIIRSETKFSNLKKNKTAAGISVTFLGETVATGLKLEDKISLGKRVYLVASTGAVRAQGATAYGANLEARLRDKDYTVAQALSTVGLSLMRWRGDLALGANLQSQFSVGRNSKMVVRVGLNNKFTGQITVRTSTSDQLQIALAGVLPLVVFILRSIFPGESNMVY